jgi:hypothetical protein
MFSGASFESLFENILNNILNPRFILLLLFVFYLLYLIFFSRKPASEKWLAGIIIFSVLMHLLFSKHGRYLVYLWAGSIMAVLFLSREWLVQVTSKSGFIKTAITSTLLVMVSCYSYIYAAVTLPVASNNIYEQQYQMHRFVVEFYHMPVAVNDLGYVSYKNENYVLDFWGFASKEALHHRINRDKPEWMNELSEKYNVKLALIYDNWFYRIPDKWFKIAELHLGKEKITPSGSYVSFYIVDPAAAGGILGLLNKFSKTLPEGVKLIINKELVRS